MDDMVTLYDVARLAGVSTATVSRVVHGQEGVREATRARVRQAIEELGYVPDGAAQSLSRRRKDAIGLVCRARRVDYSALKDAGLLYYDQVLHGVEEHIHRHDTSLLGCSRPGGQQCSPAGGHQLTSLPDGEPANTY